MVDGDTLSALQSIADSLRRLAERYCPEEAPKEKRPAVLSTAIYDREERERENRRKAAWLKEHEPQGPPA
jgi:hypothetical protein